MLENSKNLLDSTKSIRATQKNSQMSITAMIEIPKGCRTKSIQFPSDYGFILDTLAQDGDPLDVLVLMWEPTFPGYIIEVKPVGMLNMSDDKGIDQKILCVPINDPFGNHINELKDIPPHLLKEIKNFFETYKTLNWQDRDAAIKTIKQAQDEFATSAKRP